jgi:hypothetical protein
MAPRWSVLGACALLLLRTVDFGGDCLCLREAFLHSPKTVDTIDDLVREDEVNVFIDATYSLLYQ